MRLCVANSNYGIVIIDKLLSNAEIIINLYLISPLTGLCPFLCPFMPRPSGGLVMCFYGLCRAGSRC